MIDNDSARQVINGPTVVDRFGVANDSSTVIDSQAGSLVHWYDGSTENSLRTPSTERSRKLTESRRDAAELRRIVLRRQPLDQSIDQYARLITETMVRSVSRHGPTSIGAVS